MLQQMTNLPKERMTALFRLMVGVIMPLMVWVSCLLIPAT